MDESQGVAWRGVVGVGAACSRQPPLAFAFLKAHTPVLPGDGETPIQGRLSAEWNEKTRVVLEWAWPGS